MAIPKARRRRFVAAALENLDVEIAEHERSVETLTGMEKLVALGGLRELEGRRRWLEDVRRTLDGAAVGCAVR